MGSSACAPVLPTSLHRSTLWAQRCQMVRRVVMEAEAASSDPQTSFAHGGCPGSARGAVRSILCPFVCFCDLWRCPSFGHRRVSAGQTWALSSKSVEDWGCPPQPVCPSLSQLQRHPTQDVLIVATLGAGVWWLHVAEGLNPVYLLTCSLQWRGKEADGHLTEFTT